MSPERDIYELVSKTAIVYDVYVSLLYNTVRSVPQPHEH